jgi:hypothetical protein
MSATCGCRACGSLSVSCWLCAVLAVDRWPDTGRQVYGAGFRAASLDAPKAAFKAEYEAWAGGGA